jgi:RNA polymerase-binding transcription factor DksA
MTEEQILAYFGGLMDGEGHFGIHKHGKQGTPIVQLIMTDEATVKRFADRFGLSYRPRLSPSLMEKINSKNHKLTYVTRADSHTAYKITKELLPYLFTKRKDAQKILDHYENRNCAICEKEIPVERMKSVKYCSAACRQKYKRVTGSAQRVEKKYSAKKKKGTVSNPPQSLSY